ncbi:DUF6587 family protein [uncultured Pseudacidovorax sp.]|uniref:DUF6587 family protein n=1 Tax=uncultured Pseudacidovorax sp. TaxID=679313 RepID=UPI0025F39A0F|nr:DUF6587 family protein [uncultured Pseudacidovorax sp.]
MQNAVVALIVLVAAVYAAWHWMPAGWRRSLAPRMARWMARSGLVCEEREAKVARSLGQVGGCGSCDSCGTCGPTPVGGRDGASSSARR